MNGREAFDNFFDEHRRALLVQRYASYEVSAASVGTVKDYCDSVDNLGPLAGHQQDLKDIQRCWVLKAILASCAPGASLVEIGAGEPVVAGILSRFGFNVTVVDPYDGCGNGPTDIATFRELYSDVAFIQDYLNPNTDFQGQMFDAFYSISVLEHVPLNEINSVFNGIRAASTPSAVMLHAVDHVLLGDGSDYHVEMLTRVSNECGVPLSLLWEVLGKAEDDADTYFLSAEAHNRWRGSVPYELFPMRRCVSVNLKGRLG